MTAKFLTCIMYFVKYKIQFCILHLKHFVNKVFLYLYLNTVAEIFEIFL